MNDNKVILLVPPGKKRYLRDYYCGKVSKASYYTQPTDLVIQSGLLSQGFDVEVFDLQARPKLTEQFLDIIFKSPPKAMYSITGSASWGEDIEFFEGMRKYYKGLLALSGDVFMGDPRAALEANRAIDIILTDFTSSSLYRYLKGERDGLSNLFYRDDEGRIIGSILHKKGTILSIPMPRYNLFPREDYSYPFAMKYPFATVLTDYGCPFGCRFCIAGAIGFKERPVNDVLDDLKLLKGEGYKEIYFIDQTFGVNKARRRELLEGILHLNLSWSCYSRVDLFDYEGLREMKKSGCHTIIFGVESGNQGTLESVNKGEGIDEIKKVFGYCRALGLRTVATFIIGLDGEGEEEIKNTIRFAISLNPDFASFNIPIARPGTPISKEAIDQKVLKNEIYIQDQSGGATALENSKIDLNYWQNKALRGFYLRPSYIIRTFWGVRSLYQLKVMYREGLEVISKAIR